MVLLTLSEQAASLLPIPSDNHPVDSGNPNSNIIDHAVLAQIAEDSRRHHDADTSTSSSSAFRLDNLLRGAEIYILPKPEKPAPTPEYLALMTNLRLAQEAKLYAQWTNQKDPDETIQSITRELNSQISVIFNVLFSSIFTGLAVWYASASSSKYAPREALRVGASIAVAILVAVAEVVLYGSYLRQKEEAGEVERGKVEVKILIDGSGDGGGVGVKDE